MAVALCTGACPLHTPKHFEPFKPADADADARGRQMSELELCHH